MAQALKQCWLSMDQPCGKRMKDMLPLWVDHMDVGSEVKEVLKRISASSIDRHLQAYKVDAGRKIRTPKPASAVKKLVEIRAENWETNEVGWTEVDTVAHCGGDMSGDFVCMDIDERGNQQWLDRGARSMEPRSESLPGRAGIDR